MAKLDRETVQEFVAKCVQSRPRWIIPIPSEGAAMVSLANDQVVSSGSGMIYADRLMRCQRDAFNGQTAVVVDFSMFRGKMMNFVVNQLLSFGAKVKRACAIVHEDCPDEFLPDIFLEKLPGDEYTSAKDQFINMYLQDMHPYDSDHWDIKFKMTPFNFDDFVSAVGQFGQLIDVGEPSDRILRMTLEPDKQCVSSWFQQSEDAWSDTVCKIRLFIDQNSGEVTAVGLFFPIIPLQTEAKDHKCPVPEKELSVCHSIEKHGGKPTSRDCFDSCSLYSNVSLVRALVQSLRSSLPTVKFEPVADERAKLSFAALFPQASDDLWESVQRFLWDSNDGEGFRAFNRTFDDFCVETDIMADSYAHGLVATEVYNGWRQAVAMQEISEPEAFENLGVTFQELCQGIQGRLSTRTVSRAFDVLLDVGVIRPVVTPKVYERNDRRVWAWTRAYRPAGEQVGRYLKQYSRIRGGRIL